jgi:imidazolonepropionase-like amidohydrolase
MRFPGAPQGMKMACGENPKRVYGEKGGPSTRMGNVSGYRHAFQKAFEYRRGMDAHLKKVKGWQKRVKAAKGNSKKLKKIGQAPSGPDRNFANETLAKVLAGEILPHIHCYRADEMSVMLDLAAEFGFKIRSFHHALESYKIRHRLAEEQVASSTWADWWGFKMEAYDGIPYNAALLQEAGAKVVIHSDSETDVRWLNQEAAKAAAAGRKLGIDVDENTIMQWVTKNPAWAIGVDGKTGTLEKGKMADVVVWDRHPFSIYAKAERTFIDGKEVFNRDQNQFRRSDFEIGQSDAGEVFQSKSVPPSAVVNFADLLRRSPKSTEVVSGKGFVIINVRVEVGDGKTLPSAQVLVRNGRIALVGAKINSAGLPQIDGSGKVLSPGFVETFAQVGLFEVDQEDSTVDFRQGDKRPAPALRAIDGFNPASPRLAIEREHGVTSMVGAPIGKLLFGQGFWFDVSENPMVGKDTIDSVAMFGSIRALGDGESRPGNWLKLREIFDDVRRYNRVRAAGSAALASLSNQTYALAPIHLRALRPVMRGDIPLVISAGRESDIRAALRLRKDMRRRGENLRLVIIGGSEAWKVRGELASAKVPVILVPNMQIPWGFDTIHARDDNPAMLAEAGVPLIISAADGFNNPRRLRQQAGVAISYGLEYGAAMRALTYAPASIFAKGKKIGLIEPGFRANMVLWSGDPFENFSEAERIWIGGVEQPTTNRQRALGEHYRIGKKSE